MEPVSVIASALTILGTLSATAQVAIDIKRSPKSLQDLQSEIHHLQAITATLHTLAQRHTFDSVHPEILNRPLRRLKDLQKSFSARFPERTSTGVTKVEFKHSVHRNHMRKLKKEVVDIRDDFNTTIGLMSFSTVAANLPNSYKLELSPNFSPDHCIITGPMIEPLLAYSTLEISRTLECRVQKHFLLFAQHGRRWRKVIAITTTTMKQYSGSSATYLTALRHGALGIMREALVRRLQSIQDQLCWPVNQVHLEFHGSSLDATNIASSHVKLSGLQQSKLPDCTKIIDDISRRGLTVFYESQVIVIQSSAHSLNVVSVGSQYYLELRLPYTDESASLEERLVNKFWHDLQPLLAAQGCPFVAKFAGVILNDSRTTLCGYLVKLPGRSTLGLAFLTAERTDTLIPWHRKEKWIRQLITAVREAHQKGVVVGDSSSLWLDNNEDIVIVSFKRKSEDFQTRPGNVPPEFRTGLKRQWTAASPGHLLTFTSDIFALGMSIWLICEQLRNSGGGRFCRRAPFTSHPTQFCTATHSNPIELPPTSTQHQVPPYIENMIQMCRREQPNERPSASDLLQMLPDTANITAYTSGTLTLTKFDAMDEILNRTWCIECSKICYPVIYFCHTCEDFDACQGCYLDSVRCEYPNHQYGRRILENGKWAHYKIS